MDCSLRQKYLHYEGFASRIFFDYTTFIEALGIYVLSFVWESEKERMKCRGSKFNGLRLGKHYECHRKWSRLIWSCLYRVIIISKLFGLMLGSLASAQSLIRKNQMMFSATMWCCHHSQWQICINESVRIRAWS